jgi:hypothetical protein
MAGMPCIVKPLPLSRTGTTGSLNATVVPRHILPTTAQVHIYTVAYPNTRLEYPKDETVVQFTTQGFSRTR